MRRTHHDREREASPAPSAAHRTRSADAESVLHLQRSAGNRAVTGMLHVQRVKDAFGEKLATTDLKLATAFQQKHVAADEQGAIARTDWRYQQRKMPRAMELGHLPNTVASAKTWTDALDGSDTQVDTENGKWTKGVAMDVAKAWQVRWVPAKQDYTATEVGSLPLAAGGYGEAMYAGTKGKAAKQVVGGKFLVDHIENA